ncbi:hypothetical protein ACXITP_06205 [Actinotignum sanguinis]|uniref:N-acetyltransferase domain-containing protein n=2 Tax=Actinomycetaceae TaxID=2049 RepID=A0ABZ0RBR6_9ACTO|nr:hypothetical protein [Actinotignum sanguinis]WPJ88954.1 hypothetical protein R0V15_08860 [Schaalia turicensis]MDE1656159.1 hypothetical protein [Actinotignum sanguinis]MDK8513456.1 hypothetical protein [Actinotignum sanguinis]MDK8519137.1 hypothetical protein [Actinotignum sanguinis]MDV2436600.1 hypothetical protein [Actinotignum sanguinis]
MSFNLTRLNDDIFLDSFITRKDNDSLGKWLRNKARKLQEEDTCVVWVLCKENSSEPLGYFALTSTCVPTRSILKRDRYHFPENGSLLAAYDHHPALLLGKFALHADYAGKSSLGPLLMAHVFSKATTVSETIGVRYIILHTQVKSVANYYQREYGFTSLHSSQDSNFPMYKTISAAREAITYFSP